MHKYKQIKEKVKRSVMNLLDFYYKQRAKQRANPKGLFGQLTAKKLNKQNRLQYDFIMQEISTYSNVSILEIGFANGVLLNQLASKFDNQYFGVDVSEDMVKTAKRVNKTFISNGKIKLYAADIEKMPFDDESFDVAYTGNTVYFWHDVEKAVSEVKRVLKAGGKFINIACTKEGFEKLHPASVYGFSKYSLTELCDMLKSINVEVEYRSTGSANRFAFIVIKK
jgi:ubiquinone/menaquinone biosynthesis C-methylase UbiE